MGEAPATESQQARFLQRPSPRPPYESGEADRPDARRPDIQKMEIVTWLQCFGLFVVAVLADYFTGPEIIAVTFYIVATVVAGWRLGALGGLIIALAASVSNVVVDLVHPSYPMSESNVTINGVMGVLIFISVGWLSWLVGHQQRLLREQRNRLSEVNLQMETEMRAARSLQELLVYPLPEHDALEIGSYFRAARILGGDAVDLALSTSDKLAISIADVSGKGSAAALAGAVLVGMLDDTPARFHSPSETLRSLNERLAERLPESLFVTMFYGLLDLQTGELSYSNGGHDPPFVVRSSGDLEELPSTGTVLGLLPGEIFEERVLSLAEGDLLFCYTDGLTDLRLSSNERLGVEKVHSTVIETAQLPCPELVRSLMDQVLPPSGEVEDDISIIAIRYLGPQKVGKKQS